jgi:multicomponent Na+:H+ antiporter subunit G
MTAIDIATMVLTGLGVLFFMAGTLGLLRFPDTFSRLHALTKADNLGLGFLTLGLALQVDDLFQLVRLVVIFTLVLVASGTVAQLIARSGLLPHREDDDA